MGGESRPRGAFSGMITVQDVLESQKTCGCVRVNTAISRRRILSAIFSGSRRKKKKKQQPRLHTTIIERRAIDDKQWLICGRWSSVLAYPRAFCRWLPGGSRSAAGVFTLRNIALFLYNDTIYLMTENLRAERCATCLMYVFIPSQCQHLDSSCTVQTLFVWTRAGEVYSNAIH